MAKYRRWKDSLSHIPRCISFSGNQGSGRRGTSRLENRQLRFWERGNLRESTQSATPLNPVSKHLSVGWGHPYTCLLTQHTVETQQSELLVSVLLA